MAGPRTVCSRTAASVTNRARITRTPVRRASFSRVDSWVMSERAVSVPPSVASAGSGDVGFRTSLHSRCQPVSPSFYKTPGIIGNGRKTCQGHPAPPPVILAAMGRGGLAKKAGLGGATVPDRRLPETTHASLTRSRNATEPGSQSACDTWTLMSRLRMSRPATSKGAGRHGFEPHWSYLASGPPRAQAQTLQSWFRSVSKIQVGELRCMS